MKLLSWNVRYFGHGTNGLFATDAWIARIAAAVDSASADVITLQEVESGSLRGGADPQLERFVRKLNGKYTSMYFPAHRYSVGPMSVYTTGLAILVREGLRIEASNEGAPLDVTHVRLPMFGRMKQRRVLAHARVEGVDIFTTHLSLPAFLADLPHRIPQRMGFGENQIVEIGNVIEGVDRLRKGPAVLCGDFNSASESDVYGKVLKDGWTDAFGGRKDRTCEFMGIGMHLDHVFGKEVEFAEVEGYSIGEGEFAGLSDHSPRVVSVRRASRSAGS